MSTAVRSETVIRLLTAGVLVEASVSAVCKALDVTEQDLCDAYARLKNRTKRQRPPNIVVMPGHKWCSRCAQVLSLSSFGRNAAREDGVQAYCRSCWVDYRQERAQ